MNIYVPEELDFFIDLIDENIAIVGPVMDAGLWQGGTEMA
jgi:hypothetical protein